MNQFMQGALVMACAAIGLFFLRFWRKTHDRLFACFCVAFWLLGINWLTLAFSNADELHAELYSIRLLAFIVILLGIWDKNRHQTSDKAK
jgi:uncharacterized membrane protein YcjF (UPF0283 family)